MSSHPIPLSKELEYFPCYPDRFLSSLRWLGMKDFQRGWYFQMLLKMTRSKPLGYLPYDTQLWILAGAHTRQHFEQNSALVLACFKVVQFDGREWITNETLLNVLCSSTFSHDKAVRNGRLGGQAKHCHQKTPSTGLNNYSLEFKNIWENNSWKCVAKQTAFKAFNKALEVIQQQKKIARDPAIEFLAQAMEEFKLSPAGKPHGLFEGYAPPHVASWLNAYRWDDDRRFWRPGARAGNGSAVATNQVHFAEAQCPTCGGSGWDTKAGKAARCACFVKNRAAHDRTHAQT